MAPKVGDKGVALKILGVAPKLGDNGVVLKVGEKASHLSARPCYIIIFPYDDIPLRHFYILHLFILFMYIIGHTIFYHSFN